MLASRALVAALFALVVASLLHNLGVRNPDPERVSLYQAIAPLVGAEPVGFLSALPARRAGYSHSALRYALAPRAVPWEDARRPRSSWIVSDHGGELPGYEVVRSLDRDLALLRRR
ncbi:MAG TPA: hypothetical protein VFG80_00660 [Myxococcota bacterium]|nr:hypothetical protein [Myxococcota bacterium]